MQKQPFYVTTSIAYVNAAPHIGYALELVYADALARFMQLRGCDVRFVTGTDEHGQKIARKAAEQGKTPQQLTDENSALFRALAKDLDISNTDFIRTTETRHRPAVETFWKRVQANGWLEKRKYSGLYCTGCESFKTEKDLVDGKCPDHLTTPEFVEAENWFFKLSAFQDKLKEWYAAHPEFVAPDSRFNEARQLVEDGLEDVSVSRSTDQLTWGIPVPGDDGQVIYVWFDALINYLTAAGFGSDDESFKTFWPADAHVIGKDINRFHAVLWPAMLMAAGIEPPKQVAVHGWIHAEGGKKMSKTLGNVVAPDELIAAFGVDGARFLLLHEIPFRGDGDYSKATFTERFNSNLANNLGNLVNRVTSMTGKYRQGLVPPRVGADAALPIDDAVKGYVEAMAKLEFDVALGAIWELVDAANKYVDSSKPWTLAKEGNDAELDAVLYRLLETIRVVAWLIRPVMPGTSDKMLDRLSQPADRDASLFDDVLKWGILEPGATVTVGDPLFPRLEA